MAKKKAKPHLFIWYPSGKEESRQIKVSRAWFRTILSTMAAILILFVLGVVFYTPLGNRALRQGELHEENLRLRRELARVQELETQLEELQTFASNLQKSLTEGADLQRILEARKSAHYEYSRSAEENPWVKFEASRSGQNDPVSSESFFTSAAFAEVSLPERWPVEGFITRSFELSPIDPSRSHNGIDFAVPRGTPVRAAADGWVLDVDWTPRLGRRVIIDHGGGVYTIYGHNELALVKQHQFVRVGTPIALSGNSGISTAPHLHFEMWADGRPVDPHGFLPAIGGMDG